MGKINIITYCHKKIQILSCQQASNDFKIIPSTLFTQDVTISRRSIHDEFKLFSVAKLQKNYSLCGCS